MSDDYDDLRVAAERVVHHVGNREFPHHEPLNETEKAALLLAQRFLTSPPAEPVNVKLLEACEGFFVTGSVTIREFVIDAIAAARAQAEDDAKPVDEEWLVANGDAEVFQNRVEADFLLGDDRELTVVLWKGTGKFTVQHTVGRIEQIIQWDWNTLTRGDVRRLMAALGVK